METAGRIDRRTFLGLAAGAAAAVALPGGVGRVLAPAVAFEWTRVPLTDHAWYVCGLQYNAITASCGIYLGIDRSANP